MVISDKIINCRRYEYNIAYRDFDKQLSIGDKIRFARLNSGLTVNELSERLNVDRTTLLRYEHNKISENTINVKMLIMIENICNIERYSLLNEYLMFYEKGELKRLRKVYNVSKKELAAYLGINYKTVSRWETGKNRPPRDMWESTINYFEALKYSINSSTT